MSDESVEFVCVKVEPTEMVFSEDQESEDESNFSEDNPSDKVTHQQHVKQEPDDHAEEEDSYFTEGDEPYSLKTEVKKERNEEEEVSSEEVERDREEENELIPVQCLLKTDAEEEELMPPEAVYVKTEDPEEASEEASAEEEDPLMKGNENAEGLSGWTVGEFKETVDFNCQ
ncbi:hypothetical protein R5R35_012438 [Gryllus longicercus]|uniref:Uncharacterized protein n=1 Tax=Gryllus longicercus TaxID=2509291 RepID=A0AAN9VV67_9ORTH